jgi:hypothetical protein
MLLPAGQSAIRASEASTDLGCLKIHHQTDLSSMRKGRVVKIAIITRAHPPQYSSSGRAGGDGNSSGVYERPDIGARLAPLAIVLSRSPSGERF